MIKHDENDMDSSGAAGHAEKKESEWLHSKIPYSQISEPLSVGSKAKRDSQKRQGDAAFRSGDYKEAIKQYTSALTLDPANHLLLSNRSAAYQKLGLYRGALKDAQACITSDATDPRGHSRLGVALKSLQQWEGATGAFEMVLKLDPTNDVAKRELETCRSQLDESLKELESPLNESNGQEKQPSIATQVAANHAQPAPASAATPPLVGTSTPVSSVAAVNPFDSIDDATKSDLMGTPLAASPDTNKSVQSTNDTTNSASLGVHAVVSPEPPKAEGISDKAAQSVSLGSLGMQQPTSIEGTTTAESTSEIHSAASPDAKPKATTPLTVTPPPGKHLEPAVIATQAASIGTTSPPSPDSKPKHTSKNGLSELSKQLRVLQATNDSQHNQIDRLERQLRIIAELKGVSVADIRSALVAACEEEAHADLRNQVGVLRSELEAATLANSKNLASFEKESSSKAIANLQLRVGELEEIEETLKSEIQGLYKSLSKEQGISATLKATCAQQKTQLDDLLKSSAVVKVEKQECQWAMVVAEEKKKEDETKGSSEELRNAQLQAQLEKDRANLLEKQAEAREKETQLRNEQYKSRFQVQDERIFDLEQQLSSLYTAFELLRQEHAGDQENRAALSSNLREADSQVARQLHKMSSEKALPVVEATPFESTPRQPSSASSPRPSQSYTSPASFIDYTPQSSTTYSSPAKSPSKPRPQRLYRDKFIQPPATSSVIQSKHVVSGFLMKRDKNILNKQGWKKRYFVLHGSDGIYHMSYSEGPTTKIKGTIGFITTDISTVAHSSELHKQPFVFVLHANPNDVHAPVLFAAAENQHEFDKWMSALTLVTTGHDSTVAAASPQEQEAADHEMAVRMQMELMR